jgi:hypothetical protein
MFVVPGYEENPEQALSPWRDGCAHHDDYYCDVGGMGRAGEKFGTRLNQPQKLCGNGCLLVVTGPPRSGKTALINRCAYRIHTGLAKADIKSKIIDLTPVCSAGMTVTQRASLVSARLATELQLLRPDTWIIDQIKSEKDKIDSVFPMLEYIHKGQFDGKRVFIILLPSLVLDTADEEINCYLRVLGRGTILMVEAVAGAVQRADQGWSPLRLELDYLSEGEAYRLVECWRTAAGGGTNRTVREEEMSKLEQYVRRYGGNIASGQLLTILRTVCNSTPRPGPSGLDYVEYHEILEAKHGPELGAGGQRTHP